MKGKEFNNKIRAVVNTTGDTWIAKAIYQGSKYISFDKTSMYVPSDKVQHMTRQEVIEAINENIDGIAIDGTVGESIYRELTYELAKYVKGERPKFLASYKVPNRLLRVLP